MSTGAGINIAPVPQTGPKINRNVIYAVVAVVGMALLIAAYGRMRAKNQAIVEAKALETHQIKPAIPTDIGTPSVQPGTPPAGPPVLPEPGAPVQPTAGAPASAPVQFPTYEQPGEPLAQQQQPQAVSKHEVTPEERLQAAMEAPIQIPRHAAGTAQESYARADRTSPPSERAEGSQAAAGAMDDYRLANMQENKKAFLRNSQKAIPKHYLSGMRTGQIGPYEIKRGWEIPAVLEQDLNSDLPGDLKALVDTNVYDTATGQYLLIPQGSRLAGSYSSDVAYGQDGVQVVWTALVMPDGSTLELEGMTGLDSHGNAGLRHKVDKHYKAIFGMAALSSLFAVAFELTQRGQYNRGNTQQYYYPSAGETAAATVGREMAQTGQMITRKQLNRQPTVKVPTGYRFTVRVNRDILFEAPYEAETLEPAQPPSRIRQAAK